MSKNIIETVMGGVVLLVAASFVVIAFLGGKTIPPPGYEVRAEFDNASGLGPGSEVRMSGVKIGTVTGQRLDPDSLWAVVTLNISETVELSRDTSARILTDGLLGSNFIALDSGADEETIPRGGEISFTQGAINVVDLIGQLIYSGKACES